MNQQTPSLAPAVASINGTPVHAIRGVRLDSRALEIFLGEREAIRLYTFNSLMFPIDSKRTGTQKYSFEGPQLGIYHNTADVREGPFVNHFISQLDIEISFRSEKEALLKVKGSANLAASSFDPYWYKGPTTGVWQFEASFTHAFLRP